MKLPAQMSAPHHVTVGYEGEPGQRTFYVQVEQDDQRFTMQLEKRQVAGTVQLLTQLLAQTDDAPATDWDRAAMALRHPLTVVGVVGDIAVGFASDRDEFVLELEVHAALADLAGDSEGDGPASIRIVMQRDQARRVAAHAQEQVAQGRPPCEFCGRPIPADGAHVCPATNGHGHLTV